MITNCEINHIKKDGFLIKEAVFSDLISSMFLAQIASDFKDKLVKRKGGVRFPQTISPAIGKLVNCQQIKDIIFPIIGDNARLVRSVLFEKNQESNWLIPWHQDCTIAVKKKIETPGFGPWSVKDDIIHTKAPEETLASMVTLRIHFDDCGADNGALKVVPGSHRLGKLKKDEIYKRAKESKQRICEVSRGGILLMKPLLIHSSSQSQLATHRRVLHLDYASMDLPNGLDWY